MENTEEATWYVVYGEGENIKARAFEIEPKRELCDLHMNTHNPAVTTLLGFNNNITSGNRDAMYYITMYSTKKNQDDSTEVEYVVCEKSVENALDKSKQFKLYPHNSMSTLN